MKKMLATLLVFGLTGTGGAVANDGKQLYDDFRCTACHGRDGKGTGATVKAAKPIAGMQSEIIYESTMKMVSAGGPNHTPGVATRCRIGNRSRPFRITSPAFRGRTESGLSL